MAPRLRNQELASVALLCSRSLACRRSECFRIEVDPSFQQIYQSVSYAGDLEQPLTFIVILSCITVTATLITLFACSRQHFQPSGKVFSDITPSTGWGQGFSFILAVSNAVYGFLGTDCGAHMCEEISNPGRTVPRVILWPILMGLVTAWPFTVACMFAISDLEAVLGTATGIPILEIYYQGTGGSKIGATILMSFFAMGFFGCLVASGTSSECVAISSHNRG